MLLGMITEKKSTGMECFCDRLSKIKRKTLGFRFPPVNEGKFEKRRHLVHDISLAFIKGNLIYLRTFIG